MKDSEINCGINLHSKYDTYRDYNVTIEYINLSSIKLCGFYVAQRLKNWTLALKQAISNFSCPIGFYL